MSQHGVRLVQLFHPVTYCLRLTTPHIGRQHTDLQLLSGQKLVQRRVEQAHRDGQTIHNAKDLPKIIFLHGQNLRQRFTTLLSRVRHNHLAHRHNAVFGKKHMLGTTQANTLRPEATRDLGIMRGIGVTAYAQDAIPIGPGHQLCKVPAEIGLDQRRLSQHDLPG